MKQSTPGRPAVPSDHANLTKAQRTTPWRKWNLVGTRNSAKTARYIAERRKAGDRPRPLRELD
jgi:hypothetical protein